MPTYNRPDRLPDWCSANPANVAEPPDSLRAQGYVENEVPLAPHFNALFRSYGRWLGYLDQANSAQVMATTLDNNTRLVGGGNWSYNATTGLLSWDATGMLSVPGCPLLDNSFGAGSVVLGAGQAAYVNANVPHTTTGTLTSGDPHATDLPSSSFVAVGQSVTGAGVPDNTTVTAVDGGTVTLSAAATASGSNVALTFVGTAALTVQSTAQATFTPAPNAIIIALGLDRSVLVGANSGQMAVHDGESKRLLGSGYVQTTRLVAGAALAQNAAVYVSPAADGRTTGLAYPAEANATNGAMRGQFLGFAYSAAAAGETARIVTSGVANGFTGLTVGAVHYLDPATPGAITATRPTTAGSYVVPVGLALTNTSLRLNPPATSALSPVSNDTTISGTATAGSFVSGAGFKMRVDMGSYASAGKAANQPFSFGFPILDANSGNVTSAGFAFAPEYACNALRLTVVSNGSLPNPGNLRLQILQTVGSSSSYIYDQTVAGQTNNNGTNVWSFPLTRGQLPLAVNGTYSASATLDRSLNYGLKCIMIVDAPA